MSIFDKHTEQQAKSEPSKTYTISIFPYIGVAVSLEFKGCTAYDLPTSLGETLAFTDAADKGHFTSCPNWHIVEE